MAKLTIDVLGSRPVSAATRLMTNRRLRILAYHGVPDQDLFRAQMQHLVRAYRPVSAREVTAAARGGPGLPDRAVWITFDDGEPSVVENGLPVLDELGIPASLFVIVGLIDSEEPYWWTIVEQAARVGMLPDQGSLRRLKSCADDERRQIVADLVVRLSARGDGAPPGRNLSSEDLDRWLASGHEVGNHSWDHPCLSRCSEAQQVRQVALAHDRLSALTGSPPELFAYPNGDWTASVEAELRSRQYAIGLLFDHRLADLGSGALRLSRLRVDATADLSRFRSIVAGSHSAMFATRAALDRALGRSARRIRRQRGIERP